MLLGRSRSCRIIRVSLRYCHRLSPSSSSSTSSSTHTVHSISINECSLISLIFFFYLQLNNLLSVLYQNERTKRKKRGTNTQVNVPPRSVSCVQTTCTIRTLIYTLKHSLSKFARKIWSRNNGETLFNPYWKTPRIPLNHTILFGSRETLTKIRK